MYQILLTKDVAKETKKRGKKFHQQVIQIINILTTIPCPPQSEKLSGELKFIHSYHFNAQGVAFRLCYTISETDKIITIIMLGPRENFYKKLKQKLT